MKTVLIFLLALVSAPTMAQTEYFITSDDQTRLRVREFGSGKPVVLLSGGPGLNVDYLEPVWEKLSANFRCIVLDQRGTGQSIVKSVDSSSMSMDNYINDLTALRKHLNIEKLTLVGHSWGAMLAMEFTSNEPEQTQQLVLLGPGGPTGKFYSWFGDNLRMRLHDSDRKEIAGLDSLKKSTLSGLWPGYFYDRDWALRAKAATDFTTLFGQPLVSGFTVPNYLSRDDRRPTLLRKFTGPVTIIQGRQDPIGESTAFEIQHALPQAHIHFIEKCGHLPWLENEEQRIAFFHVLVKVLSKR